MCNCSNCQPTKLDATLVLVTLSSWELQTALIKFAEAENKSEFCCDSLVEERREGRRERWVGCERIGSERRNWNDTSIKVLRTVFWGKGCRDGGDGEEIGKKHETLDRKAWRKIYQKKKETLFWPLVFHKKNQMQNHNE